MAVRVRRTQRCRPCRCAWQVPPVPRHPHQVPRQHPLHHAHGPTRTPTYSWDSMMTDVYKVNYERVYAVAGSPAIFGKAMLTPNADIQTTTGGWCAARARCNPQAAQACVLHAPCCTTCRSLATCCRATQAALRTASACDSIACATHAHDRHHRFTVWTNGSECGPGVSGCSTTIVFNCDNGAVRLHGERLHGERLHGESMHTTGAAAASILAPRTQPHAGGARADWKHACPLVKRNERSARVACNHTRRGM